jgi:hypothetical protein
MNKNLLQLTPAQISDLRNFGFTYVMDGDNVHKVTLDDVVLLKEDIEKLEKILKKI